MVIVEKKNQSRFQESTFSLRIKEKFKNLEILAVATWETGKKMCPISRCFIKQVSVRGGLHIFDCSSVHRHGLNDSWAFFFNPAFLGFLQLRNGICRVLIRPEPVIVSCAGAFEPTSVECVGFGNTDGDQDVPSSFCTEQTRGKRDLRKDYEYLGLIERFLSSPLCLKFTTHFCPPPSLNW